MGLAQKIWFHEADLIGVQQETDGTICLLLEGAHADDQIRNAAVRLGNVRQILLDGSPVDTIIMEQDDGEVLTLEKTTDFVRLIIEWMDYKHHQTTTRSYCITCDSMLVELM
jgi:hypothetical protein